MARLAAVEKGEYYPTPLSIVDTISQTIDIKEGRGVIRLFDPCAGKGLALERLAALIQHKGDGTPIETWGIEISPNRARQATKRLDTVLEAPFEATTWSPSRIKSPVSLAFVNPPYDNNGSGGRLEQDFLERVTNWLGDGSTLVLIVPWKQVDWRMCGVLAAGYQDLQIFRFPDASGPEGFDAFGQVVIMGRRDVQKANGTYTCDEAQEWYNLFHPRFGHPIDAVRALPASPNGHRYTVQPVGITPRLRRKSYTWEETALACREEFPDIAQRFLPHNAEMDDPLRKLKVGHIAQVVAAGLVGTLVARDKVFKGRAIKTQVTIQDPVDPTRETVKDVYETHISCVTPEGYMHLATPHQVARFLKEHADLFRQHVEAQFHPYGTDVQEHERTVLDTLSLDKQLPGRKRVGLFEDQKVSAVALTRSIERYGVAHLVAQMGYGKSRTSLAAVELMGAYPALICCPPHLVEDWVEEAEGAIPGLKAVIVESISELDHVVESYQPGDKLAVIVSHSRIKMGPGWTPAYNEKTIFVRDRRDKRKLVAKKVLVCPGCGKPLVDGSNIRGRRSLEKKPLSCHHTVPAWDDVEKVWEERPCATPLYQFSPTIARRWPLADYIAKKLPRFFRVLVFDEVHKGKAKDTDIAWAFQVLARLLPTITLTGTFFGGLSTSIFYLLYRTQANVRGEFGFDDERRWAEHFGVLETIYKVEEDEFGVLNARKRRRLSTKEQPGLSPEAIRFMLSTTVFAKVADLGMEMPACVEDLVPIELGPLDGHIGAFWDWTWDKMVEHWPRWTSAWLQWNLARPNSAFREELVEAPDDELLCPAQVGDGELLPKEAWLVNLVKSELAQGRKVIVYPRQTGTRDIRPRLQGILAEGGVTDVAVLGANVGTRKRKRWLQANARPVLITNPRLVETGMNLHEYGYSTIIFFEIEYSLYTLWQAMSRVWRPGQTRKVKIFFSHYVRTLEEKALSRMGRKMMAGQLLYGEDVTSALVEDTGDASLVIDLIRAIQDEQDLAIRPDTQIFGTMGSDTVTDSPMGSPTMRSRPLTTAEQWLQDRGLTMADVKPRRSRRKKAEVPENQLSFLDALPKVA